MDGKDKIEKILDELELKAPTFAKNIGIDYNRIYDIQRKKTKKITADVGNAISKVYPQYSLEWLTEDSNNISSDTQNQLIKPIKPINMDEKERIGILEEALDIMKRELQDKQRTIDALAESNRELISYVTGNPVVKKKEAV